MAKRKQELVICACGCGELTESTDVRGRPRRYVNGHNRRIPRIDTTCTYCGTQLIVSGAIKNESGRYFCNRTCFSKYTGDQLRGTTRPDWVRQKISKGGKGKKLSEECKRKISEAHIGRKLSDEHRHNLSIAHRGDKHSNGRGGTTSLPYPWDWNETLREAIRQRDNYSCRICGITQEEHKTKFGKALSVHYIDYERGNSDPKNLVALCNVCHTKTNWNRKHWPPYFQKMLQETKVS